MMSVKFSPNALEQIFDIAEKDKKLLKKLKKVIEDTQRNGTGGVGHPEQLSGNLAGWWSKHVDGGNRIVFRIVGETAEISECCTHYGDK